MTASLASVPVDERPVQQAAVLAFGEPAPLVERIALSRRLHARVAREVAFRFASAGASVPPPQAAFYVYPDFTPLADVLRRRHGISSDEGLAALLLRRYGLGTLPGSAFGERPAGNGPTAPSPPRPRPTQPSPSTCPQISDAAVSSRCLRRYGRNGVLPVPIVVGLAGLDCACLNTYSAAYPRCRDLNRSIQVMQVL